MLALMITARNKPNRVVSCLLPLDFSEFNRTLRQEEKEYLTESHPLTSFRPKAYIVGVVESKHCGTSDTGVKERAHISETNHKPFLCDDHDHEGIRYPH